MTTLISIAHDTVTFHPPAGRYTAELLEDGTVVVRMEGAVRLEKAAPVALQTLVTDAGTESLVLVEAIPAPVPVTEPEPAAEEESEELCDRCAHQGLSLSDEPCRTCSFDGPSAFEPRTEALVQAPVPTPPPAPAPKLTRRERMAAGCPEGWLTSEDAAARLGCGVRNVYRLVEIGDLEGKREGSFLYVSETSVERVKAKPRVRSGGDRRKGERLLKSRPSGYLTIPEAAEALGLSEKAAAWHVYKGKLDSIKVSGFRYVLASSVEAARVKRASGPVPGTEEWLDKYISLHDAAKRVRMGHEPLLGRLKAEGVEVVLAGHANWVERKGWSDYLGRHPAKAPKQSKWRPECRGCSHKGVVGDREACEKYERPLTAPTANDGDCVWLGIRPGDRPRDAARPDASCECGAEIRDGRCSKCGVRIAP